MSQRPHTKSKIKILKNSMFQLQDKSSDDSVLSNILIRSVKRSGQLSLVNKGLGSVPDRVWMIDEIVLDEHKDIDFNKCGDGNWWNVEPLKILDLSSNAIKVIPPQIRALEFLTNLKLHDNAIESLPSEIGELKNLTHVNLSHNKLVALPKEFYLLTDLRTLNIANNLLETIPPEFGDLVMLTTLNLSYNKLVELPPGMGYLVRLTDLNISHNKLVELPPDIVNLRELRKFYIMHNELKSLPALGELRRMEILDANHNNIIDLPDFYGCAALKELYLANNCIKEITEEFCEQLQHQLRILNLRDNHIEILPENIALLNNLKRLDITNNNLNKLPKNMGLLSQLQSLSLEGNKLTSIRQDIIQGGTERVLKLLRERSLDADEEEAEKQRTPQWPDKYTIQKCQGLICIDSKLDTVPAEVFDAAAAVQAHIVDLSRNHFEQIPNGISKLSSTLTQLVIKSNKLKSVSTELGLCKSLQYLELSCNMLVDLPLELGDLKQMREIVISNNRFKKIPRCVYSMDSLEILLAGDNQIEEVNVSSDALSRLKRLSVLDLRNNDITSVPPELGNLTQLRCLEITGNSFRIPRHSILEKGTESILAYLRDRIP